MRSPLRSQIFTPVAGLLALALVLFTAVSSWHAVEVRRAQTTEHLSAIANSLSNASYPLTEDIVERIGGMIGGDVVVASDDGQVTATTVDAYETLIPQLKSLPQPKTEDPEVESLRWNSQSYLVASIKREFNRQPKTLFVLLPQQSFPELYSRSILAPLAVALVILVLAVITAMSVSGRVARRIEKVRALFGRLAEGDFRAVEVEGRDDEIRDLMVSANALSEQLRSMQQELLAAQRLQLLGQLSGGLAHQLKNSVAGARLALQLHEQRCDQNDPMVKTALAQLDLTEQQVHAVVSLKNGSNRRTQASQCDVVKLTKDVVALLQPLCSHWKSQLTLTAPNRLETLLNSADSLRGALLNIMQNAIEAAGVRGKIDCRLATDGTQLVIDVRDSGPGFADTSENLLGAFRTTKPEGLGLGLTIAQHAVDQEGGTLSLRRVENQTSVLIQIPLRHVENPDDQTRNPQAESAGVL